MLPRQWVAYCGPGATPEEWMSRWVIDPVFIAMLGAASVAYWLSAHRQGGKRTHFLAAQALLVFLFVSPFCALGAALFSARVAHHVILIGLVAPLLVASLPSRNDAPWRGLLFWTVLQTIILWAWHAPPLYDWAVSGYWAFWTMQLSLLLCACGFWAALRRAQIPGAVAALLATTVQMGLLGALIVFATRPLYAAHYLTTEPWGLSPLEDQQLGGLIMWAPAAGLYLAGALLLISRALGPKLAQAQ